MSLREQIIDLLKKNDVKVSKKAEPASLSILIFQVLEKERKSDNNRKSE